MLMSRRWAQRSKDEFNRLENPNALFGIVQGTLFEQLRADSGRVERDRFRWYRCRRSLGRRIEGGHAPHPDFIGPAAGPTNRIT